MTALTALDVQQLLAAEPFVRTLARSLVAGDADEVVQQVWLRALQHRSAHVHDARGWLARVVRSVAANRHRSATRRRAHEQAAAREEGVPSSLRLLELEETRRSLLAAVDALPGNLRDVVLLRFYDGLPPRAVARELGVPAAVVWRQQQRALALLRARLDATLGGDRRERALALVPLALAPRGLPWRDLSGGPVAAAVCTGVLAMTAKSKVLGAAAVLLLLLAIPVVLAWPPPVPGPAPDARNERLQPAASTLPDSPRAGVAPAASVTAQRTELAAAAATTGALAVRVHHAGDGEPARDVVVLAWPAGTDRIVAARRSATDGDGTATFGELPDGRWHVATDRSHLDTMTCAIDAGATTELEIELAGLTVTGVVVDAAGAPVAGAVVEVMPPVPSRAEPIATTGADGRFRARGVRQPFLVGARAAGHASSERTLVFDQKGDTLDVQLVLPGAGGVVAGTVTGPDGPVAGAAVQVGAFTESGRMRNPRAPAVVYSEADGSFRAVGVPAGEQPVQVRAAGLAPWRGTCTAVERATIRLDVLLQQGGVVTGVVRDAGGAPVADATVAVGNSGDPLARQYARTRGDGTFVLGDLPSGQVEIAARHERAGKGTVRVEVATAADASCEIRLSQGVVLRGRVVFDDDGMPAAGTRIVAHGAGFAVADAAGRFTVANWPEGLVASLTLYHDDADTQRVEDVDPRAGEAELRLRRRAVADGSLHGQVLDPDGLPCAGVQVLAGRSGQGVSQRRAVTTGADGRFVFERLVPGAWWLTIEAGEHPEVNRGPYPVPAGTAADAGTLRLAIGGTVRARLAAGDPTGVRFQVHGATCRQVAELQLGAAGLTSGLLEPGEYELAVSGAQTAEQTVPFAIRAGEETRLELRLAPGVRQRIEIDAGAATTDLPADEERVLAVVRRDDEVVRRCELPLRRDGRPCTAELWLAPGSYVLTATRGDARTGAAVPFAVGAVEGPTVRFALR